MGKKLMLTLEHLRIIQADFHLTADLAIAAGGIAAVIGPSGAGKSTLLSAIAGFIRPTSGRILWQGIDLAPLSPGKRPMSVLFQDQNLFPHLTVAQNLGLGVRPDLSLGPDDRTRVAAALARVGLDGFGPRLPASLSGGQQSRVALARALLRARPLLLLDEPFSALGPALKAEMLDLVAEIATENATTALMVSHEPADARRIAGQTVLVANGVAHPPHPTLDLLNNPPAALAEYLGQ
jgi:thiamine transport system ATP-binding protein